MNFNPGLKPVVPSAARASSAAVDSAEIVNDLGRGVICWISPTLGTGNIASVGLFAKVGSSWVKVAEVTGMTLTTATGAQGVIFHPLAVAGSWLGKVQTPIPRGPLKFVITPTNATSLTYSVDAELIL